MQKRRDEMKKTKLTWSRFIKKNVDYFVNERNKMLADASSGFERRFLCLTLAKTNGNIEEAASLLKISNNELKDKMDRLRLMN